MQLYGIYYFSQTHQNNFSFAADASIYNKEEILQKLNSTQKFNDAEIIQKSYERWQEKSLQYLVGDFSFTLFDKKKQELFAARDHLGIRSFYYYHTSELFAFSSDLDHLFSLIHISKEPDIDSLQMLLNKRKVDHEKTIYKNIRRLPPGHFLKLKSNGTLHLERYWEPEKITINTQISKEKAIETFRILFSEAVRSRLSDEGTTGCELSGGLDSTSVCSIAHKLSHGNITAFSLRFGSYACDEGRYIEDAAKKLSIAPVNADINTMDFKNTYNMDFNYYVNPHWPLFLTFTQIFPLAKAVKEKNITVVLTGQGGDHIMSGSRLMIIDYAKSHQGRAFLSEFFALDITLKNTKNYLLLPLLNQNQKNFIKKILHTLHLREDLKTDQKEEKTDHQYKTSQAFLHDISMLQDAGFSTVFDSSAYHTVRKHFNIEYRHPFFDIRLVEFMLSLPAEFKYSHNTFKVLLREAMRGVIPETIRNRKDKAEFSETIRDQLNAIDIEALFINALTVQLDIVSREVLDEEIAKYKKDTTLTTTLLWTLVNIEYWLQNFTNRDHTTIRE